MARIKTYDTQVSAGAEIGGRRASATDFGGSGGFSEAAKALGNTSDLVFDAAQRQDVSNVRANLAKARADWTVNLQERLTKADPGDPNFASTFNADFASYMSQFGDGIATDAGRRAFEEGAATLSADFVQKSGLAQVQLAGVKARQDAEATLDHDRNTLLADPTQFDSVLKSWDQALSDPNSFYAKMPPDQREKFARTSKADLALSTVEGMATLNPDFAQKQLESGRFDLYLDADRKFQLGNLIKTRQMAQEAERERVRVAHDRAERKAQMVVEDGFVKQLVADPTQVKATDIANSNMSPEQKLRWVQPGGLLDKALKEGDDRDTKLYGSGFLGLWDRVHSDGADKIVDEGTLNSLVDGSTLTVAGLGILRGEIQGKRTVEGAVESELKKGLVDAAKSAITATNQVTGFRDPRGDEQLQKFMAFFLPEYQRQRAAGKTAIQLLTPDSPDYIGKAIDHYKRPQSEFLKDLIQANPDKTDSILSTAAPGPGAPAGATSKATNAQGDVVYLINGKWVRAQ